MSERLGRSEKETNSEKRSTLASSSEAVRELKGPLSNIIGQLEQQFRSGEYDYIIGDDVSGRISTLILGKVARHIARKNSAYAPEIRFVAGSRILHRLDSDPENKHLAAEKRAALRSYFSDLAKNSPRKGGKLLISTDAIDQGHTVSELLDACHDAGWSDADVATVGMSLGSPHGDYIKGARIYSGGEGVPTIIHHRTHSRITGIDKLAGELHSFIDQESDRDIVVPIRKVASDVGQELIDEYDKRF